ncbi:MAG: hypothetical protein LBN27_13525 [Prevotellaceae bacterium]|jgi:YD repeat-containing protein|nr:hypothetical protein [Prevotellaceae bacterium]
MKKIYYVFILLLFSIIHYGYAADNDVYIPRVIPVSPNAASLGQYGEIPVNYYTGTPEIKIPLYEIESSGMKVPISISYHSSGIKVAQEASWIGLGWTLNAGGCIVRQCIGGDDLQRVGDNFGYLINPNMDIQLEKTVRGIDGSGGYTGFATFGYDIMRYDTEPDIFQFNFCNYSGSMYFNASPFQVIVKNSTEYIQPVFNKDKNSWTITDGFGVKYYFGGSEESRDISSTRYIYDTNYGTPSQGISSTPTIENLLEKHPYEDIITAWYLDSIVAPNKNKIVFEYKSEKIASVVMSHEDLRMNALGEGTPRYNYYSFNAAIIKQVLLSKITFPNGEISFSTSGREDIKNKNDNNAKAQKLDKITISNKTEEIKSYTFDYTYLGSQSKPETCRLLLMQLNTKHANQFFNSHQFTYNMGVLPAKNSRQIDFWGFYNNSQAPSHWGGSGSINEGTLIPSMIFKALNNVESSIQIMSGRDRSPHSEYMQYGVLQSIKYPTGGISHFEYEPHKFSNAFHHGFETTSKVASLNILQKFSCPPPAGQSNYTPSYSTFTSSAPVNNPFSTTINSRTFCRLSLSTSCLWNVKMESANSAFGTLNINKLSSTGSSIYYNNYHFNGHNSSLGANQFGGGAQFYLDPGTYSMSIEPYNFVVSFPNQIYGNSGNCSNSYLLQATFETFKEKWNSIGGGLRIKRIYNTVDGQVQTDKEFNYTDYGISTGHLSVIPFHYFIYNAAWDAQKPPYGSPGLATYLMVRSSPIIPLTQTFAGSPVSYSKVEEINKNAASYRTVYSFHNYDVDESVWYQGPPALEGGVINSYVANVTPGQISMAPGENGLLKSINMYDNNNRLVEKIEHSYKNTTSNPVRGMNKFWLFPAFSVTNGGFSTLEVAVRAYTLHSEWLQKEKTVTTKYFNNGLNNVVTTVEYLYDNTNYLPKQLKTTSSSGKTIENKINYTSTNSDMKSKHIVNLLADKSQYIDNVLSEQQKIHYKYENNQYLPEYITYKTTTNQPVEKIRYNNYDNKGNILQKIGQGNVPVTYLWSYKGQYPIAEIKNATYDQVKNALTETLITRVTNADTPASNDLTAINNLRNTLPNAFVTTYTYKPLVGVTKTTDPRGITTYYEYDNVGRLKTTYIGEKDANGNETKKVLKTYDYHYANQ